MYGGIVRNFPETYHMSNSSMTWKNDPDFVLKVREKRVRLKWWLVGGILAYFLIGWKVKRVERYDGLKRRE